MIIRATNKLLNISRIPLIKREDVYFHFMPGEWYASLVTSGIPGGFAIHFLHTPSLISILIPGKSLNRAVVDLPKRISEFLSRNGYSALESAYRLDSGIEVYATNSRSMLAHMNQMKYNIEYHLAMAESMQIKVLNEIEDIHLSYLFGGKELHGKYIEPTDILSRLLNEHGGRLKTE